MGEEKDTKKRAGWVRKLTEDVTPFLPGKVMSDYEKIFNSNLDNRTKGQYAAELLFFRYLSSIGFRFVEREYLPPGGKKTIDWLLEKDGEEFAFEVFKPHHQATENECEKNMIENSIDGHSVKMATYWVSYTGDEICKKIGAKASGKTCDKRLILCVTPSFGVPHEKWTLG